MIRDASRDDTQAPCALECVYFHPLESVLNFGVVILGPGLLRSHVVMVWYWSAVATTAILVVMKDLTLLRLRPPNFPLVFRGLRPG